ncbi:LysR family transcriptional regulator [Microtetraspora sp. AC03309]|uniref:LysR family transcriptional regulator n=1 Tax=Microtetraspora sp. AC03309 TaxID=2779376 RepID=UPI001E3BA13A|nr:LysR family transcriptional regulator [Microtetraspora sp. AC03309]MCC5580738.1 LysR family transcriptional regulator [Microtetraspora sp. AC03309]
MEPSPPVRDIRCFALVARHRSFSRAAAEMGMSQPAMSQAIGRLERALRLRLFERTSREVRLSQAGAALLPQAEALLATADSFAAEAARLAEAARPVIRLAYAPVVGALAARVARRLSRRRPAIGVELRAAGWNAATAALTEGDVSAAILSAPFPLGLTTAARFHVPVGHLAVPAGDPLATLTRIGPERLAGHRIIVPRNRPPGGMWARLAGRLRGPHQLHAVADEIDDFTAVLDLVAAGIGLLPVPHLVVSSIRRHDVRFVPFGAGDLRMTYGLAWRPERVSGELMALAQTVQESLWTR